MCLAQVTCDAPRGGAPCLLDQCFYPVYRERNGARVAGGEIEDAGAILKDVPAAGAEASRVLQREAECGSAGAQREVNATLCGVRDGFPDSGVDDSTCAHQRAVYVYADQSNR